MPAGQGDKADRRFSGVDEPSVVIRFVDIDRQEISEPPWNTKCRVQRVCWHNGVDSQGGMCVTRVDKCIGFYITVAEPR